jgi:hypothetical protein
MLVPNAHPSLAILSAKWQEQTMFPNAVFLPIILLPSYALANSEVSGDVGVIGAITTLQNALPMASLAVFGAWAVLQYAEAWEVDDGPLSGLIAWWRWQFWMPP